MAARRILPTPHRGGHPVALPGPAGLNRPAAFRGRLNQGWPPTIQGVDNICVNASNTILYCNRWAETVDFYGRVLGLPVNVEKSWFVEFRLTNRAFVSVADAARASIESAAGRGLTLALQVPDIEAVHQRLTVAGVEVPEIGRHPWGALSFFCRDPEGYRLEFWQPVEQE